MIQQVKENENWNETVDIVEMILMDSDKDKDKKY